MCGVATHQIRLPQSPSNLVLSASGDGKSTTSLGVLRHCLTTPWEKKFLLMSNLNFHSISFKQFILPCPVTIRSQKKSVFLIISSLSTLEGAMRSHCSLFFSKLNQLYSLGLSSSPSFFRTLGCISHGPTALYTFRLMRNSRTCSSFTVGGVLLPWPL